MNDVSDPRPHAREATVPDAPDARDIARRNRAASGKGLNPVMKTAATACELGRTPPRRTPPAAPGNETD